MYKIKKIIISSLFCIGCLFSSAHAEEGFEFFMEGDLEMFKVVFPEEPQTDKFIQDGLSEFTYSDGEKTWSLIFAAGRENYQGLVISKEKGLAWTAHPEYEASKTKNVFPYYKQKMSQAEIAELLAQAARTAPDFQGAKIYGYTLQGPMAMVVEAQLEGYVIISWFVSKKNIYQFITHNVSLEEHRKFVKSFEYTGTE